MCRKNIVRTLAVVGIVAAAVLGLPWAATVGAIGAPPAPCRLLTQTEAQELLGYPVISGSGVLNFLKLGNGVHICTYSPTLTRAKRFFSWSLAITVTRGSQPRDVEPGLSERHLVVNGVPAIWQWDQAEQVGVMSAAKDDVSFWVDVSNKGGTPVIGERLARQAVSLALEGIG